MKRKWLIFIFMLAPVLSGQTKLEDVKSFTLKNGMKFLVVEDHSIPNANFYAFFRVGSRNEVPGITGLSHFFEHMMFNGSKKYGPKMFDRVMEAAGGSNNAYTSENVTVYTNFFPSNAVETIFDLEADRIANLTLDPEMIESERGVVLSERITGIENSNFELLYEQVLGVAYFAHPYRWSVIGYESDIKNWSREDLVRYFETYYAPNNAVAVMVGDIRLDEIKSLAEQYFEPIPSHDPPRPIHTTEPAQLGEKRLWVHKDVTSPNLLLAYHVPETRHEDYYALDLLNAILTEGRSSRLYRALIDEKQVANQIFSFYPQAFDPTLFFIFAVCSRGIAEADLEQAVYAELERIQNDGVTEAELQKAKNTRLVNFYSQMETIDGRANILGTYELFFGSYDRLFAAPQHYEKVTPSDIQRIVAAYFTKSNRTVGILKTSEEKE